MRLVRGAALGALTSAALLCTPTVALALAGEPGGASAPSSEKSGGSEFGVPASVTRPVVSELVVPSSALPGRPPKVTVRVLERGVGTVSMRVLITNLSTHKTPVIATLGWVHTSRQLTVAWPRSARLVPGAYKITVSAKRRSPPDERPVHEGHEWIYVLHGRLRLILGEQEYVIQAGEAVEFSTWTPHWFGAIDGPVELIAFFGPHGERAHLHR